MSDNYKVFMSQVIDAVNEIIKEKKITEDLQIQPLQMMGNGICICMKEALKDPKRGFMLNQQLLYPWKSAKRLLKHCIEEASKRAIKNSYGGLERIPVMIDSNMITEWIFEYFALDDKEQVEEELRKAEEKRIEDEEKKRKKEEAAAKKKLKLEKDLKKAEVLIEKNFAFAYKYTEKDIKLFESLKKAGLMDSQKDEETKTVKWFVKEVDEPSEDDDYEDESEDEELDSEDEAIDEDEDLGFIDA